MKKVALIDLDTPIYAASCAIEKRNVIVTHEPTKLQKEFNTRTEFKELLKTKGKLDRLSEYSFEDKQEPEPVENACQVLKVMVNKIIEQIEPDEVRYYISGKNNFRDSLELPHKYKGNRAGMLRPIHLSDVRKFATNKFKAVVCEYNEPEELS